MADGHLPEQGVLDPKDQLDPDVSRLCAYYEEAEEAQYQARLKSERDRDYVDNKQLTDEEVNELRRRGQPPIALNVVRSRAAFLSGMEKKQRRDPKAYPRNNPQDVGAAEAFTDGMRYVVETTDYASKRSQAWKNITVEGFGGVELAALRKANGDIEFTIARIPWDRAFYDPHSSEPDFSDARYFGQVLWMDYDEALARAVNNGYVDERGAREVLDTTLAASAAPGRGRTYDDKPKWSVWGDQKRKRVRIVMMWHREVDGWKYCEFTKSGKLDYREQVYLDQDGESYCPWLFESANVDRDNNRYGEIRHLIDPQDEINKRRSKALHLLNTNGVIADEGAVNDIGKARRQLARPDFWLTKNPGLNLEIVRGADLAAGQANLGAQAMDYIMQAGPNAALLGKGVQDQSGRAIEAQQAGGLVEQSDLMDTLRRLDWRVFRVIASMMKQFWDAQKWVRVTDDDKAPRWVGLNEPMWTDQAGQTFAESEWQDRIRSGDPQAAPQGALTPAVDDQGQPLLNNHVARLDMDILVSDAPDQITLAGEDWQAMTQLLSLNLPPDRLKLAIEMHPNLPAKRKQQFIDMIDKEGQQQPPPGAQRAQELEIEKREADIVATRATAYAALAAGEASLAKAGHGMPFVPPMPDVTEGFGDGPQGPPAAPPGPQGPPPGQGPAPQPAEMPPPPPSPQSPPAHTPMAGMMSGHPA